MEDFKQRIMKSEIKTFSEQARAALLDFGHTAEQIDLAIKGQLSGTSFWPSDDDGYVKTDWLFLETLRGLDRAADSLRAGNEHSAQADIAESQTNLRVALMSPDADHGRNDIRRRQDSANSTNAKYADAREHARQVATDLIATNPELEKAGILESVSLTLIKDHFYSPESTRTLWKWLTKPSSVIPDHISRPGPRKKSE